jgi:DNA polymerase III epsilon subunit-like protein
MIAYLFDTETSGLLDNHSIPLDKLPEVIEFYGAAINLSTGELTREINTLIKPKKPVSEEITRITSITNEMLADAPVFREVAGSIKSALEMTPCVIAHNLSFDMEMIETEFERLGEKIAWPARRLCTVEATIHLKGFRLRLNDMHELLFNERFAEAHRAKNDVMALKRCCEELFKRGEI